jgi:DNA-binding winged helix-turn-helix (wHTH) protein/tetratricopeptide (TPR) repeat protein
MNTVVRFAGFEIDRQRAELRRPDGQVVRLRPKPFTMLQFLAAHAGRVVGKQELMEAVWPNVYVGEDNLFQCIREIRTAIGDDRRQIIKVVSGRGYLFDAEIENAERAAEPADRPAGPGGPPALEPGIAAETAAAPLPPPAFVQQPAGSPKFGPRAIAIAAGLAVFAVSLAVAAPFIGQRFNRVLPVVAVLPFVDGSGDAQVALMAANVTDSLVDGLSKIPTIRVLAPKGEPGATAVAASPTRPDYVLRGEIQKANGVWNVQARIVDSATDEVRWTTAVAVDAANDQVALQQSRITAGVGYPFAAKLSSLRQANLRQDNNAKIVIDQAQAFITRTSREKFNAALDMLEKAITANPDNVDLRAELAAHLIRGIQTAWYAGADAELAETRARNLLEGALKAEPNYLPLLQSYCRLLTATNHFADSLIACARALNQDPWDGLVLFHIGMTHIQLGRYDDALSAFLMADRHDTPQVSRWTWLLGVGVAYVFMDRSEEALPWLKRSLAITPGTGRTHFVLAAAYQRLGRHEEARAALAEGMKIRPGTTAKNVSLPAKNTSPTYLARLKEINALMIAAGMPTGEARTSAAK